nr:RNA polymerase sigma-70 factor [Pedobacter sp. ASV19]
MTAYSAYNDQELAAFLSGGDRTAFTEIYNRYKGILYVHAYKRLKDDTEAEDAVHDLFAQLWLHREKLNLTTGNLAGYLYKTIRNNVLTTISRRGYADKYFSGHWQDLSMENAATDYRTRENQLKEIIEKHVAVLPKKMREVFELSRNAQLSHKEIADKLGISEHTVKSQINSALNILRSKLGAVAFIWMLIHH